MSELRDLYQELILDHQKRPRNFKRVSPATHETRGLNPLCGDNLVLTLRVDDGIVADIGFEGSGCAISKASASMMTERVKGRSVAEAIEVFEAFHSMLTVEAPSEEVLEDLGKLGVFSGVREFPARVKCATLSWQTLRRALAEGGGTVSTE